MNSGEEHAICEMKVQLAAMDEQLKAAAQALILARDMRQFMWALMLNLVVGVGGLVIGTIALFTRR